MYFANTTDQTLFGESDLPTLLSLVREICDTAEDVCVWHHNRVVAVVHGPAPCRVTWLAPEFRPVEEAAAA